MLIPANLYRKIIQIPDTLSINEIDGGLLFRYFQGGDIENVYQREFKFDNALERADILKWLDDILEKDIVINIIVNENLNYLMFTDKNNNRIYKINL